MNNEQEKIELQYVTYEDVKNGVFIDNDDYHVASEGMKKNLIEVVLSNPFLKYYDRPCFLFSRYNGVVGGRVLYYPTKMVIDDEVCDALSSSDLFVEESLRNAAIGLDLVLYPIRQKLYCYTVFAGLSPMAKKIQKKLPKTTFFETPKMRQYRNVRAILQHIGVNRIWLPVLSFLPNQFVRLYVSIIKWYCSRKGKDFVLKKLGKVPSWVDKIVLNDGHKYKEYHNHEWMQWALDYDYWPNEQNKNEFVAIYKDDKPIGFFFTKVRCIEQKNGMKNFKKGAILEWGTSDESVLSEETITKLALSSFDVNIDYCEFTSQTESIVRRFKKYGFIEVDKAAISLRDLQKKNHDFGNINNWRIRLGYADTIFY